MSHISYNGSKFVVFINAMNEFIFDMEQVIRSKKIYMTFLFKHREKGLHLHSNKNEFKCTFMFLQVALITFSHLWRICPKISCIKTFLYLVLKVLDAFVRIVIFGCYLTWDSGLGKHRWKCYLFGVIWFILSHHLCC